MSRGLGRGRIYNANAEWRTAAGGLASIAEYVRELHRRQAERGGRK